MDTPTSLRASVFGLKVIFHLRLADSRLAELVSKFTFIHEVKVIENKLIITLDNTESDNPEIIRTLVSAGADILFVGELRNSLEDVYLQLVKSA